MIHIYKLMYVNLYLEYWLEKYTPKMLTIVYLNGMVSKLQLLCFSFVD